MKRKYRKALGNGVRPKDKKAWCVHCDEWEYNDDGKSIGPKPCNPSECACNCHTQTRKPKCLCAVVKIENPWDSPVGCCMDCDCRCHVAEQKEADRTEKKRAALWKAELKRRDQERFDRDGVHEWEKKTLEFIMLDPRGVDYKYSSFVEALSFSSDMKKAIAEKKETGTEFMKRMRLTPWGSNYIRNITPQ